MSKQELKGWKEIPEGGTVEEPGSSTQFNVQSWRTNRPEMDKKKCTKCGMCWLYCPEAAIKILDDGSYEIDLTYCKGCGICSKACALKAITMVKEEKS
jgi:pyruvate ferredoxin oxidoreductase delta subunit